VLRGPAPHQWRGPPGAQPDEHPHPQDPCGSHDGRGQPEAHEIGAAGRALARERFGIGRFVDDWIAAFDRVVA